MNGMDAVEERARVRAAHVIERDAQLRQPGVMRFIAEMEHRRLHNGEWHSIFSLMRDGRDLAKRLSSVPRPTETSDGTALREAVDPYLQVARAGTTCEFTGLDLFDVWRYFRHTWTTTYQSTPGRKVFFLVRDRAAANHPVVAIAALGSPIVQLSVRDRWIGWTPDHLITAMRNGSRGSWMQWLDTSLERLLSDVYTNDFVKDGVIPRRSLRHPTVNDVAKLRDLAGAERRIHRLYPEQQAHKAAGRGQNTVWSNQAKTHLFRSKRASTLADLLAARIQLQAARTAWRRMESWTRALATEGFKRAVATVLRQTKAAHVGVEVMDITVCGAIAPYNHLLGGKLVSLLMASPQVRAEYARRYKTASSIIASSMAGRTITRPPRLVLLGTTSLYGVAPSQYNRLKMPAAAVGGPENAMVSYECLGRTAGYGSYHFSRDTLASLEPLLGRLQRGRPVNSIFGEGVNPKLRKVRAALDAAGLPSNLLLQHGSPRLVYGIPLAKNFREILLGVQSRPSYLVPDGSDAANRIVDFWFTRWVVKRIQNEEVLTAVASHSLASPVRHGARVVLPDDDSNEFAEGASPYTFGQHSLDEPVSADIEQIDEVAHSTQLGVEFVTAALAD
ncbi:MAG TPA: Druantia anti-phage system protein DruA [Vicinamibacterales bacterium]|nr:Druantia anti-phage system protein DruA [Vicinamibacterales bacterium]HWI20701.1 Druantia anti-phage system protein DruA [Vicinamibacterales bacterium]